MTIEKLKKEYEKNCNEYLRKFCKKQDLQNGGWVNNNIGGIAFCSDFTFNFNDIVWDINSGQKKGLILSWYNESLESVEHSINYYSYTKGLRIKDLTNKTK